MNCWHCKTELIWGGDHDIDEENEDYNIVTNLSCPKCYSHVDVYNPSRKLIKEYKDHEKKCVYGINKLEELTIENLKFSQVNL